MSTKAVVETPDDIIPEEVDSSKDPPGGGGIDKNVDTTLDDKNANDDNDKKNATGGERDTEQVVRSSTRKRQLTDKGKEFQLNNFI